MVELTQSQAALGAIVCFCFSFALWFDAKMQTRAHKHVPC